MMYAPFRKAVSILALALALAVVLVPPGTPTRADSIVVTNRNDSGADSLRQAILDANASAGGDTITFGIRGCVGVCLIQPLSALPMLTGGEITIDGYSEPGAVEATATTAATIRIEIDGTNAGAAHGLHIGSSGNVVRGLSIVNFERNGVRMEGSLATGNVVSGNHIGIRADGTSGGGNGWAGVSLNFGPQNNTIGGDEPGERNVISGNQGPGMLLTGSDTADNTISGNYVGTDANGTSSVPNLGGIVVTGGTQNNTIGGDAPGERNVVSGNTGQGINLSSAGTVGNTVSGNFVGVDASGANVLPNTFVGVNVSDQATHNTIGGDTSGEGNVISGNSGWGVGIQDTGTMSNTVLGNFIGTDATGTQDLGNAEAGVYVRMGAQDNTIGPGNIIAHNALHGVQVGESETTGNIITQNRIFDNADGIRLFGGAHGGIAPPVVTNVGLGSIAVTGTACASCTVELFANGDDDGEGELYLGSTPANGDGDFTVTLEVHPGAHFLTATATDPTSGTSEFSAPFATGLSWMLLPVVLRAP